MTECGASRSVLTSRHVLSAVLLLTAAFVLYGACTGFRCEKSFQNPIAYAFLQDTLYVVEKEANTILALRRSTPGEPMAAAGIFHIEKDDDTYYYMVRKIYPASDGLIVHSYVYRRDSKEFVGYRFSNYRSLGDPSTPLLAVFLENPKDYPEITYTFDREGNHYFANNCGGHYNIWKIPSNVSVTIEKGKMPQAVGELGERNRSLDKWEGIAVGPDGRIFVSSGATGRIVVYSSTGEKLGEIGAPGFQEGDLLAPGEVFFLKTAEDESELLTVAGKGNRTWVQFDPSGNVVRTISPLKERYPFPDVLVGRIYAGGTVGAGYSFDLANKNLVVFKPVFAVTKTYMVHLWGRTLLLLCLAVVLVLTVVFSRRIESRLARLKIPFYFKMLALFVPLLAVSAHVVGDGVKDIMKADSEAESIRRSANLARAVVNSLSIDDLEQIQNPEDREGPVYDRIYQMVSRLVDVKEVEQTPKWILHKIRNGRFYFGINIWRGAVYQPFIVPAERRMFFEVLEEKSCRWGRFIDDQGEWFSYLHPILDEGKVIYVLELYRPGEQLDRAEREAALEVKKVVGVTVLTAILMLLLFSYFFTRPLRRLMRGVQVISRGDFDCHIEVRSRDELGDLAGAFNQMQLDLKKYTLDLARSTAEKESIQSELRLAREMQQEILPKVFPPFAGAEDIEIFARMEPAKEVGGDYYDFFMIDDTHIGVVVADVCGKGVPAGLFMMRARAVLRSSAVSNLGAADALARVNQVIAQDNPSATFVTMFYFICNVKTGNITFCNAGHNPPVRLKNAKAELVLAQHQGESGRGLPIGVMEEACYTEAEFELGPGEVLVLYTDGVTESVNAKEEMFGEDKLLQILEAYAHMQPRDLCNKLFCEVYEHQRGLDIFDDVTVLLFKLNDRPIRSHSKAIRLPRTKHGTTRWK